MVDHRASPGLPEELARKLGMNPAECGEGKLFETASLTCSHCKTAVMKNPLRVRERAHCFKCDHYVCDLCAVAMVQPDYVHTPFEKRVDENAALIVKLGSPPELL